MKKQNKLWRLMIASCLFYGGVKAQLCPTSTLITNIPQTASSQDNECIRLKEAFVPAANDRVLTVNLNIYIFNESDGSGYWSHNNQASIDNLVTELNVIFSSLYPPHFTVPGVPFVSDTKIRFVKKLHYITNDTHAYENYDGAGSPEFDANINDCNAINILFVKARPGGIQNGHTSSAPGRYVYIPTGTEFSYGDYNYIDSYGYIGTIAHELGHALGLKHTNTIEGYAYAKPEMGAGACCDQIRADDVHLEYATNVMAPQPSDEWGRGGTCNWNADPNWAPDFSNNVMGYNGGCRHYLSPYQMAIMHYHLRTNMRDVLTTTGAYNALTVDHNFDYSVTTSENWGADRYMKGDVIVKAGGLLTITCNVAMTRLARIVVEPGGQLVIDGGRVTNISGQTWSGIQVGGITSAGQSFGANGFASNQGVLRIKNNGTICNADNGVKNYMTDANFTVMWQNTGGIIVADHANFINNTRDVEFYTYPGFQSATSFYNCNFKTDGVIGIDYNNNNAEPLGHVSIWDCKGIRFRGCNFEYAAGNMYNSHGWGILSYNASYSVDKFGNTPTVFKKLNKGVYAESSNPLYLPAIFNSVFDRNTDQGAHFKNLTSVSFSNNQFYPTDNSFSNGLYLNSCTGYNINNNTFDESSGQNKASYGITAYNSRAGSHLIYRNNFSGLQIGIAPVGNNSGSNNLTNGLKMNCNTFNAGDLNKYDISMMVNYYDPSPDDPTVKSNQGGANPQGSPYDLVRNLYGAVSICNNCENQWYIQGQSVKNYLHPSNSDAYAQPLLQPALSDIAINVSDEGIAYNASQCPVNPVIPSGNSNPNNSLQLLSYINDNLEVLQKDLKANRYEIQTCVMGKLNLFLTDSVLQNPDSVIAVVKGNAALIENSDALLAYAYMYKGDLENAQITANQLLSGSELDLLNALMAYEGDPSLLKNLSNDQKKVSFFETYAETEKTNGYAAAQAILGAFTEHVYIDPNPVPQEDENNLRQRSTTTLSINAATKMQDEIALYPNPTSGNITIVSTNESELLQVKVIDVTGKLLLTKTVTGHTDNVLEISSLKPAVYLVEIQGPNKTIRKKLIKTSN